MNTPGHGDFGSAYHPADHSRPQYLRQGHVPPDGFQTASLERRWRKALVGTVGPVGQTAVQSSSAGGQDLCPHFAVGGQAPGVALVGGGVTSLPRGPTGGHQEDSAPGAGRPADGQPPSPENIQETTSFPGTWSKGSRWGSQSRPDLAGHLATQEGAERGGTGAPPNGQALADHFSELIRGTFLEEVPMGMVEAPFSKEAAASRCGCASEDLCPGPLAGIDEGDKIRTIYDGSVGGANDTIRNQTVERTTAPTVLDGVQGEEGPPLSGCLWPQGGDRQTSTWGLALAGAGHQVGSAQGGRHQGPPESEGPQEGLAVPGGLK